MNSLLKGVAVSHFRHALRSINLSLCGENFSLARAAQTRKPSGSVVKIARAFFARLSFGGLNLAPVART
ncbi:MAG: hypothetical protein WCB68_16520 [Pyrinomonadaceae bacterium]